MSKSSRTLKITKGGTIYTCDLYTTAQEARRGIYPDFPILRANVDGVDLYAASVEMNNCDTQREWTPLVIKDDGTTQYCVSQRAFFSITITTVANETITITANNQPSDGSGTGSYSFTSGTHWFPYGTTWTASVAGATGYNAGSLTASSGTVTNGNVTVTAGAASLKTYTLALNGTSNQTITLKYKNRNAANTGYEAEVTKTSTGSNQSWTVRHGTTWTASVAGATGWTAGSLSPGTSGTVTAATTVKANAATYKTFALKLNGTSNQTITLKYKNKNSNGTFSAEVTKTSTGSAQSWTVGYGTTWTASLAAATGYTKGTLSGSSGTVTSATTVSATAATAITPTISFSRTGQTTSQYYFTVTYTNTSGSRVTTGNNPSSVKIKYNTTIVIKKVNAGGAIEVYQGSTYKTAISLKGNTWTSGGLTGNTTFKINGISTSYQSGGEG